MLLVGVVKGKMGNKLSYLSVDIDLSNRVTAYGGNTSWYWLSGIAKAAMAQKNTDDNNIHWSLLTSQL